MDWKNIIEWLAIVTFIGGIIITMISHQLVIRYTQKNLKSLCYYLYGDEYFYEGKLNMYQTFFMTFIATPIFIQYHFVYKRKGYLPMFKGGSGTSIIHANLDEKNALLLVKKHYKWLVLNVTSLGLGLFWLIGSSFFIWWAKRIGS
ncbi:hypothetical protein [uncultured Psychrobacter sp.]|uniref:hypothetical protein n=1 Tax=uncultured Psychrobacter sp. TaxID=259303 RepID=UPI00345AE993